VYAIFRDSNDVESTFETIAVIEFNGILLPTGQSFGHYICDVKEYHSGHWYRTNDNNHPFPIAVRDVSTQGNILLLKKSKKV